MNLAPMDILCQLKIGPGTTIVLNSARVLHELLHARSGTTSDRPPNHFVDITTGGLSVVLARYTDTWKSMRRVAHDVLTREACMDHLPIQRAEATQLMYDLLEQPQVLNACLSRIPDIFALTISLSGVLYSRTSVHQLGCALSCLRTTVPPVQG